MIALEMFQGPFRGFNFVSQPPNITYDRVIVSLSTCLSTCLITHTQGSVQDQ